MSNSGQVSLGELRGKLTMLEITCSRCDDRTALAVGQARFRRLAERHCRGQSTVQCDD